MTYEPKDMVAMKDKTKELHYKLEDLGVKYVDWQSKYNCYMVTARFLQDIYQIGYDDAILTSKL